MRSPESYKPKILKQRTILREIRYGVGIQHIPHEFGITDGPFDKLEDALNIIGEPNSFIIRFETNESDTLIYRWHDDRMEWLKIRD